MPKKQMLRPWMHTEHRHGLSADERRALPENSARVVDLTDAEMSAVIGGDERAITELLLKETDDLSRFVSQQLGSSPPVGISAEDILQDTFYEAVRDVRQFKQLDDATFGSWLRGIAKHRLLDAVKRQQRKKRGGDLKRHTTKATADSYVYGVNALPADETLPFRNAVRHEANQCVRVALAGLTEEYRQAIMLRYIEGQTYEQISRRIGRSQQAVHGLLKRAKKKLREALGHASAYLSSR